MKKQGRPAPFAPPTVRVSTVEPGSKLDLAERARTLEAATPAEVNALIAYREDLQPSVSAAKDALDKLRTFQAEHAADLQALRSISFDAVRGRWHDPEGRFEATRTRAAERTHAFMQSLGALRDNLTAIEKRVDRLKPEDLRGPRMTSDAPGIKSYDDLAPAAIEQIRFDAERAVRRVNALDQALTEVQQAVAALIEAVDRKKKNEGEPEPTAHAIPPETLAMRAAGRPQDQQTSYGDFPAYESDRRK
jgi:hypothetical protein